MYGQPSGKAGINVCDGVTEVRKTESSATASRRLEQLLLGDKSIIDIIRRPVDKSKDSPMVCPLVTAAQRCRYHMTSNVIVREACLRVLSM